MWTIILFFQAGPSGKDYWMYGRFGSRNAYIQSCANTSPHPHPPPVPWDVFEQAGFEALYFGRIDYQDREKRIAESDMEMLWRPSRSLEDKAQIFTGEGEC